MSTIIPNGIGQLSFTFNGKNYLANKNYSNSDNGWISTGEWLLNLDTTVLGTINTETALLCMIAARRNNRRFYQFLNAGLSFNQ